MKKDMTKGPIYSQLILFTIPLVLGNIFQLTYNAVDSIIVGRYIGKEALAAVGTASPVMNIVIFFISGICMGASIIMSQLYGAKEKEKLQVEISTTMRAGLIFSLVMSILGVCFSRILLSWIHVPDSILLESSLYLQTIFLGLVFMFLYNFFANTLRALGDSKTPLYFLIISSVLNVVMDVVMVAYLNMGVFGCALATVIAEGVSCALSIVYIQYKVPLLCLGKKWLRFDYPLFVKTVKFSFTSALQQATLYIGKLFVQSFVNPLGVDTIAAFNVVNRIDDFAYTPQQNIGHAMTTFIAQNRGAGHKDRVKEGFRAGLIVEFLYVICLVVCIYGGKESLMNCFLSEGNRDVIVSMGVGYLTLMCFFYILPGLTNGVQGYFRGIGDLKITLLSTFMNMFGRVFAAYFFAKMFGLNGMAYANLAGWIVMLITELPLLYKSLKMQEY